MVSAVVDAGWWFSLQKCSTLEKKRRERLAVRKSVENVFHSDMNLEYLLVDWIFSTCLLQKCYYRLLRFEVDVGNTKVGETDCSEVSVGAPFPATFNDDDGALCWSFVIENHHKFISDSFQHLYLLKSSYPE